MPIRSDRSAINVPETEIVSLYRKRSTYANKVLASPFESETPSQLSCSSYYLFDRRSPVTPSRAKSSIPPERSVISHRWSRHHFGLISKLRFVIYNGHVYSGGHARPDSLFSQLCPLRADQFTFDSTKNKSGRTKFPHFHRISHLTRNFTRD